MAIHNESNAGSNGLPPRAATEQKDDTASKLHVGIIGAGIAGLMAAVTMLESGHDVEIFEKSLFKSEVGAAICAPPNSARILAEYGFDFKRARATSAQSFIFYQDPSNIDDKKVIPCTDYTSVYGAHWEFFHRVDLHSELRKWATEPTATRSQTARLHLGSSVSGVDEDGTIRFEDGTSVQKDVVIVADGIRSSFLSTVVKDAVPAKHQMSILRYMVPSEELMADPDVAAFFKDGLSSIRVVFYRSKRAIIYGCRGGSLQNIGIMYPPDLSIDADGHDISATDGFASKVLAEFPNTLQKVCSHPEAKSIGQWKLFTRTPLERLARGRVVLVGDAAHPMPPLRAQGASMAIEDAAALGVFLSKIDSKDVPTRLDLFNKLRVKRVAATQLLSSEHAWDPTGLSEEQRGYFEGKVPQTESDIERYSFGHDVIRDAQKILRDSRQQN